MRASLRTAGAARELGNAVGGLLVSLPVGEPDAVRRLLDVVVNADADAYPDVDVLLAGMRRAWASLTSGRQAA